MLKQQQNLLQKLKLSTKQYFKFCQLIKMPLCAVTADNQS